MLAQIEFESRIKNGTIAIPKPSPLSILQDVMNGEAQKAGFDEPDDVVKYIKSRRKIRSK